MAFYLHFHCCLFLTTVFLCAHIVVGPISSSDQEGNIKRTGMFIRWKQLLISVTKKFFSWFIGGLNYQIEHHLFPSICHVHYYELSKIVKETALEFGLPYHANRLFTSFSTMLHI